ncbi:MAG: DUF1003 domain-containing protein [Hyphomicrobium sp.]
MPDKAHGEHRPHVDSAVCALTGRSTARADLINIDTVRPSLATRIRKDHPNLTPGSLISLTELARYRSLYVKDLLAAESGELSDIDHQVAESLAKQETLSQNIEAGYAEARTTGEHLSDLLARFGGSWTFLIVFSAFLAAWMLFNAKRGGEAFDPYPFILLNLILSTIAAMQAPIIMMSQRRQEAKDRLRSLNDYRVNLKAELEIRHLHEKIDHLINNQWQRLAEIQQLQLETMAEKHK